MRPAEAITEVAELDRGQVLHETEEVGPGRHHRTAHVVLGETLQLPEHGFSSGLQVSMQIVLHGRHARIVAGGLQRTQPAR